MKIIEALKEFPLIEKKIQKNIELINQYSAAVDNGSINLSFETADLQKREISALIQSNTSLVAYRAKIRRNLALTNATVQVEIGGMTKSISEWIEYRQFGFEKMLNTFAGLNDNKANTEMRSAQFSPNVGIKIVRFYNEIDKNTKMAEIVNIRGKIDSTLEIVNATTELIES